MSGSNHISQFRAPTTRVQTGVYEDGRPIYTQYADTAALNGPTFLASDYGATGDGVTDDTAAIQAAINAAQAAGGGRVLLPASPCLISAPLVISVDNVTLQGAGWASELVASSSFGANPMIHVQSPGTFRYGIILADFFLNGSNVAGIIGAQLDSTYHALVDHVRIRYCLGTSLWFNGVSTQYGAYNYLRHSTITDGGAGTGVLTNYSEWLIVEACSFVTFATAGGIGVHLTNLNCQVLGCQFDNTDTALYLDYSHRASIADCQFDRGGTRFVNMRGNQGTTITGCVFNTRTGTGTEAIYINDSNNNANSISGCTVEPASGWPHFINEDPNTGTPGNIYTGNATGALDIVLHTGVARGNAGYNPVGHAVTQPAVPASTTAQTNTTGVDCMVYVTGGTVTAIAVGGTATGLIAGAFLVPAGSTITLTYSAAPTWQWFGA